MKKISLALHLIFAFTAPSIFAESMSGMYLRELDEMKKISGNRKEAEKLHLSAMEKHKKKDYAESERLWYLTAKADPAWVEAYFNLACATALQGKPIIAISYLEIALGMDKQKVLPWAKNDSDLAPIRGEAGYRDLMDRYSGMSRTLKETLEILDRALKEHDPERLKSIVDDRAGLRIVIGNGKNIDTLYERPRIGPDTVKLVVENYTLTEHEEKVHMSGGDPSLRVLYQQTDYRKDPSGSQMKCESWRDNYYFFRLINGSWYLIKVQSSGNGGC